MLIRTGTRTMKKRIGAYPFALVLAAALFASREAHGAAPPFRSGSDVWVAASAHSPGSNSTFFITDVWIEAPGAAADVDVYFLRTGLDKNNGSTPAVRVSVPAGGQLALPDILGSK